MSRPIGTTFGDLVVKLDVLRVEYPKCGRFGRYPLRRLVEKTGPRRENSGLRQLGPAMQYYQRALLLNRRHRSAHEHLGELYLVLGEPAAAQQQLARLEDICLIPCVETDDLKRQI